MQCTLFCTQGACGLICGKKRSSAGRFFCPALHSIIDCFVYFLLPAALPAHAAALFPARPLSGFPARSSVPQANPAFPIWSCGTLHQKWVNLKSNFLKFRHRNQVISGIEKARKMAYFRAFLAFLSCRLSLAELRSTTCCFETVLT